MKTAPDAGRADPFGDLTDFGPTTAHKAKPEPEAIRRISEENNFPSRAPARKGATAAKATKARRQYRTGRNVQFNMKASAEAVERFHRIADTQGWVLGETLEHALDALEAKLQNG